MDHPVVAPAAGPARRGAGLARILRAPATFLADPEFWVRWAKIVVIDLLLAGDNALVIALAVRSLPHRQQLLGRLWGTAGAVVLRVVFIAIITQLLRVPLLPFVGGLVLVWIAVKLIRQDAGEGEGGTARQGTTLMGAIWIIIVADVTMSLDNVIAIAGAAHGDLFLVVFGIALSIPIVVWASGILARLMNRYPWIIWAGGGVLGEVAGDMMIHDRIVHGWLGPVADVVNIPLRLLLFASITALGWRLARRAKAAEGA
jgi:YjbE family integral membrane protein